MTKSAEVEKMAKILEAVEKQVGPAPKGRIIHVSLPPELAARVDKVLAMTDWETYSQMTRISLKRTCDEVLGRAEKIKAIEELDKKRGKQA